MANNITINQHYVPQFLLNRFGYGDDDNKKISIYDIRKDEIRNNQSIKENFSQNYFYDVDNFIENFLEQQIETPASNAVSKIVKHDLTPIKQPKSDNYALLKFICCQQSRTVQAREDAITFINEHFKQIVATHFRLKDIDADPNHYKIVPKGKDGKRNIMANVALGGIIDSKAMEDLTLHLLVNKTKREFIIADHPVARYNQFYQDLNDPRMSSLTARGLQLFLPLSPTLYLCVYDSTVYKYGTKKSFITEIQEINDVDYLNELQARGALSYLAFKSESMGSYVRTIGKKFSGLSIYKRCSDQVSDEQIDETRVKNTFMVFTTQRKLKTGLTAIKILKKAKPYSTCFQERSPDVSAELMQLKQSVRANRVHRAAEPK